MADIAALGLRVDGIENLDKATQSLNEFSGANDKATKSVAGVAAGTKTIKPAADAAASATDKLSAAEQKLAREAERAGISVGQMKAALRGVPAQFTDIAISLQSGMNPLTVFLQQGGQLKDMFGGAGVAAKALGGYILGLVNPYTVAAASVAALGVAYYQGSKEADVFRATLAQTGNSAGVTVGTLQEYARQMADTSGTQGKAAETLNLFVAAGVRAQDNLVRFASTAQAWEKATGEGVDAVAEKFAALQKEPVTAALKLNDSMNFLTVSVYSQIKALEEQGKTTEAARVAMEALDTAMAERAKNIEQSLGYIERAWNGITGAAKRGWDAMLDVGRPDTTTDKIRKIQDEIDKRMSQPLAVDNDAMRASREKGIAALQRELMALQALQAQEELNAAGDAERLRQVQARAAWDKITAGNLDKQAKMEAELTKVREAALQAGIQGKELEDQLAAVREKYAEKTKKASTTTVTAYQSIMVAINEKIAATEQEITTGEKQTEADKLRVKYQQELITRSRDFTKQQRAEIEAGIERLAAQEAYNDALEYSKKVSEDYAKKQDQQIQKVSEQVEKLRLEEDGHKLAAAENITHAEAMERLTLARLEDALAQMQQGAGSDEEIARLDREIAKRRQLLELMGAKGTREANEKAAKDLEKQWGKTAQTVGDTLADYIMGGGKDAATYLKRLFSTLVLQPVVQGLFSTGSAQAGQAAAAGGSNAMSLASSGQSLWSAFSGNLTSTLGGTIATLGTSFGVSAATAFGSGIAAGGSLGLTAGLSQGATLVSAGGTAAGIGTMIGAVAPYAAAAVALYSIIKSFDNSGTPHYGAGAIYQGGNVTGGKDIYNLKTFGMGARGEWTQNAQTNVTSIATALGTALDGVATSFGQKAGYSIYTAFADDSSSDGAWGSLKIADAMGNVLANWEDTRTSSWAPRIFSNGEEGYKEYLNSIAVDVKSAFVAMDLPAWADNLLNAANDLDTLNAALNQIAATKAGFDALASSMSIFKDISEDLQTQLLAAAGSMQNLTSAASSYYGSSIFTEQERMLSARKQLMQSLADVNLYIDPAQGDKAKQLFRDTVAEAMRSGQAELAVRLMAMSNSFAQVADYAAAAVEEIASKARDVALSNLEAAVNREKTYWQKIESAAQDAIGSLGATLNLLRSNARDLYATIGSTQSMLAAQGVAYIESAIAAAKIGKSITQFNRLEESIAAARSGVSAASYSTQFEQDRANLVLAGKLTALEGLTDDQLSVQERQLKAAQSQIEQLDKTLEYWQSALSNDQWQIDATLSVADAVAALAPLLANMKSGIASYAPAIQAVTTQTEDQKAALYLDLLKAGFTDAQIRDQVNKTTGLQTDADWNYLKKLAGIPSYAVGTPYVPEDQLALLHEGEMVTPKQYNPNARAMTQATTSGQSQQDARLQNAALLSAINQLLRVVRNWDVDGLPSQRPEYTTV